MAISEQELLKDAIAELRASARWTVGAAASVGAVLLGGGPLVALGKVNDAGDVAAAIGGLSLALSGVILAILSTGRALTPRMAFLSDLDKLPALQELIRRDPQAFYGPFPASPDGLRRQRQIHERVAAQLRDRLRTETDPERRAALERARTSAAANIELIVGIERRLLEFVHAWQVTEAVARARRHTVVAIVLVAVGAMLFLTSVSDNKSEEPPRSEVKIVVTPVATSGRTP